MILINLSSVLSVNRSSAGLLIDRNSMIKKSAIVGFWRGDFMECVGTDSEEFDIFDQPF